MKNSTANRNSSFHLRVKSGFRTMRVFTLLLGIILIGFSIETFAVKASPLKKNTLLMPSGIIPKAEETNKLDVTGRVVDTKGKPVHGATVRVKDGKLVTITDADGKFVLRNVNSGDVLVISYQGYTTRELSASANLSAIQLTDAENNLNDVVVIGMVLLKRKT